uniref:Alanine--tRNA ligase n=1 Tax=Myripristis murdjan TaxID=586833 RepID=A0A667WID5_9TELE
CVCSVCEARAVPRPACRLRAPSARALSGGAPGSSSARVRRTFLDFFEQRHGHRVVPSSPVRPRGDPSLLFVNAGMNQFKPLLLGTADPRSEMASYRRVANSQKCVRAGGKHNDLEDVGRDVYHHTFFEMLGSWSFGDYFKEEACSMAWTLLTEHYGIPPDRLYVSYFGGEAAAALPADEETRQIWLSLGVPAERLLPFGLKENFWEMGDSGPCGPCTEIHYDHQGARDAAALVNADCPDVVEIWNLVFMQYNREADRSLRPLPQHSVDTGMGLERLVSVLQGKRSNYDTDLFSPLMDAIQQRAGVGGYRGRTGAADQGKVDMAYRVVADHVRTLAVCIADGVNPGMSGAELVLRRILRRAVRFSVEVLQAPPGALASLVPTVVHILVTHPSPLWPRPPALDEKMIQFLITIKHNLSPCNVSVSLPVCLSLSLSHSLSLSLSLCLSSCLSVSQRGSEPSSSSQSQVSLDVLSLAELQRRGVPHTDDRHKYAYSLQDGRYVFPACRATVLALYSGQALVSEVSEGQRCGVLLDRTCFYAEQGGQSHDQGFFTRDDLQDVVFPVEAVVQAGGFVVHQVTAAERLQTGDQVTLHLDQAQRLACMVKHTATHLLNFALRRVLGPAVQQRGSHVAADRLRFDFSVKGSVGGAELQQVESCVQSIISANQRVYTEELPLERARAVPGLRTVYPDPVRVVSVAVPASQLQTDSQTSVELCCGTHLLHTGAIQDLVIVSERQMVRGVSRVVAVTGPQAAQVRPPPHSALMPQWQRRALQSHLRALQRSSNTNIRKLESRQVTSSTLRHTADSAKPSPVLTASLFQVVMKTVNQLSAAAPHSLVMLLAHQKHSGKVLCACQVPKGSEALPARDWAVAVCRHLGGSAGGSALVAKGTGSSSDITEALRWAEEYARRRTSQEPC